MNQWNEMLSLLKAGKGDQALELSKRLAKEMNNDETQQRRTAKQGGQALGKGSKASCGITREILETGCCPGVGCETCNSCD